MTEENEYQIDDFNFKDEAPQVETPPVEEPIIENENLDTPPIEGEDDTPLANDDDNLNNDIDENIDTPPETEIDEDTEFQLDEDQVNSIISEEFDGRTIEEIKEILNNPVELEPQFASEEEKNLYNFIKDNNPKDFSQGAQEFYRLQGLDVDSMSNEGKFEDLLFEQFKLENKDFTTKEAKRVFESEFKSKYPSLNKESDDLDDELTELQEVESIRLKRDGIKAAEYINDQRKATLSTETDDANLQADKEQERARNEWESGVDKAMEDFDGFELSDGENPFNFTVENQTDISEMMKDTNKFWGLFADESGMVQPSLVQEAVAFITNKDQLIASLIDHGINIGQEKLSTEINNSSRNERTPSSSTGNSTASSSQEAMDDAILNGSIRNGPKN